MSTDPSVPDVIAASDHFWGNLVREKRGDENVPHVSDLKECNRAVWFRLQGFEPQPFDGRTRRMFQMGHAVEAMEARAIAEGLARDGWDLTHGQLYWLGHRQIEREGLAAALAIEQEHENGLIGGKLPASFEDCVSCQHPGEQHDALTGACAGCEGGKITCGSYVPRTSTLGRTVLVGHADYTIRKAWVAVILDCKSRGFLGKDDIANPRRDYIIQSAAYAFAEGAREFGPYQICRNTANVAFQWFLTKNYVDDLAVLTLDRLRLAQPGAAMPEAKPPHKWSCERGRDGKAYCKFSQCPLHPDYNAAGSFEE